MSDPCKTCDAVIGDACIGCAEKDLYMKQQKLGQTAESSEWNPCQDCPPGFSEECLGCKSHN